MTKIQYFLAGIYQGIKNNRPDGTPYFNMRLLIIFALFLHYVELAIILRRQFMISILPHSKTWFLISVLSIATFLMYLLSIIIPLELIQESA